MCFTKVWDFPDTNLTWKDSDLELLSSNKKGTKIPNLFRKLMEVKSWNVNLILMSEEYILLKDWWVEDDKILIWLRARAIKNKVLWDFDFILNRWWNNTNNRKRNEGSI
jgi:hypothetical protein